MNYFSLKMELDRIIIVGELQERSLDGKLMFAAQRLDKDCHCIDGYIIGTFEEYRLTDKRYNCSYAIYVRRQEYGN